MDFAVTKLGDGTYQINATRIDKILAAEIMASISSKEFNTNPVTTSLPGSINPTLVKHIITLIKNDNKINSIKTVREMTSCGLKEAKDLVDWVNDEFSTIKPTWISNLGL